MTLLLQQAIRLPDIGSREAIIVAEKDVQCERLRGESERCRSSSRERELHGWKQGMHTTYHFFLKRWTELR